MKVPGSGVGNRGALCCLGGGGPTPAWEDPGEVGRDRFTPPGTCKWKYKILQAQPILNVYIMQMSVCVCCIYIPIIQQLLCTVPVPYSGKFLPGKNFAKPRCVVLQKKFTRFIFAHMRLGEIKFHGIINNYSFQRGSLAVSSSLEKCLAAAESPFSLAIWTSVHYLVS